MAALALVRSLEAAGRGLLTAVAEGCPGLYGEEEEAEESPARWVEARLRTLAAQARRSKGEFESFLLELRHLAEATRHACMVLAVLVGWDGRRWTWRAVQGLARELCQEAAERWGVPVTGSLLDMGEALVYLLAEERDGALTLRVPKEELVHRLPELKPFLPQEEKP